uniref:Uncharacterized protein n=1 Tax=Chelonoidis abingdonii TaxID=106734 RepID=A0A8C0JF79_CHEAB
LLGIFFNVHSAILIEDVPFTEEDFKEGYRSASKSATTCFIAAGLYCCWGLLSILQVGEHLRKEYMVR